MLTLSTDHVVYTMSPHHPAAARTASGDTVVFETLDCFGCQITREEQLLGGLDWDNINPATGPLYVEGAQPGDILKVEILDIALADHGVMTVAPGEGVFGEDVTQEHTKILPIQEGRLIFNNRLSLPLRPMIGVIGTAPAQGEISTGTPGSHGGNMDCRRIGTGTALYLPVHVAGALLAIGDLHASMGDGEVCICGVEIRGAVTVRLSVLKDCILPTPFLVTPEHSMAIFSAEELYAASKGCTRRMRSFLIDQVGMAPHEAGMILSATCDLRICQVVDPMLTCRMEVPRAITQAYGYSFP